MDDIAVRVTNVSKNFALPHERARSVKEVFVTPFKTAMHKNTTNQQALKDVSFDVKKGEFFGIVGRNGSGKSTLLKMIAGIYRPSKGKIQVNGKLVPFIELGVGFNPELTGRQNVYLNGALLGFSEKEIAEQYDDIVKFAELENFMDQKLKNYSSGMQVRLAFSMAVRAKAGILLIDEVLAVGDADFQRKCFNYFKQLKQSKTTVIFVTHDMTAVRQFCDRAMLIDSGKISKFGNVEKVALSYASLFSDQKQGNTRIGSGKTYASRVFKKLQVNIGEDVVISGEIVPQNSLENPILGFVVQDASGLSVLGTNTKTSNKNLGNLGKARKYEFVWHFENILSDGDYTVDIAILAEDGTTVVDWWSHALRFTVKKVVVSPYPVSPYISLNFKDVK